MRKKRFFKPKYNRGYTLTEMLITVAIIIILAGISIIGIAELKQNLKMAELDDYAKIIYLEAQDQLGIVETEGALGAYQKEIREAYPAAGTDKRFLKELYALNTYVPDYPIADVGQEAADKMWENMCYLTTDDTLATKMISHTSDIYLNGGSYLIEFNPKTGDIYSVFYWESDTAISYEDNIYPLTSRERSARKATKIGYYGGAIAGDLDEEKNFGEKVTLINGEELYLKISFKNTGELAARLANLKFRISITGEHNNTVTFDDVDLRSQNVVVNVDTIDFHMLLDSMYVGHRFNDIVNSSKPEGDQVIVPGENISIKVETTFTDASGNVLNNVNTVQGNSLFANATNNDQIGISAMRHMMNLNRTVYDADNFKDRNTVQYITDIDFNEDAYSWEANSFNNRIYKEYGTAAHPMASITPIVNATLFKEGVTDTGNVNRKVTGKNATSKYVLRNFVVDPALDASGQGLDNVGIFGEVHNVDFSNIYVENITVNAESSDNVGSLIGCMEDGSITECGVYLATSTDVGGVLADYAMMSDKTGSCHDNEMAHRYDTYRVKGKNNVGGLVGKAVSKSDVKIDKAFAAIKTEGANEYVGGLIGYAYIPIGAGSFAIEHSYASGDAIGQGFVGGFAGGIISDGDNKIIVTDNYSTGNVFGTRKFGGFLGKTQKADYTDCISYGEVCKYVSAGSAPMELAATDMVGGFVHDSTETNINSTYDKCLYMGQIGYNRNTALKDPTGVEHKDYSELLSKKAETAVATAYPYNVDLYMMDFPFRKLVDQRTHYGDWPKRFIIDTSLVYYEKYENGSYGYYCVTTASGTDMIWLLDTLKPETCVEDGYGLLTKHVLDKISYDLYVGNQSEPNLSKEDVGIVYREEIEGQTYEEEAFVCLNQQGSLTFEAVESYDTETGEVKELPLEKQDSFEVKGLYLYQLPYDLQCTNRKGVPYFYDRIVFTATAKGGINNKVVIEDQSYFYCPHFAKTAYNPNVSSTPIDLTSTDAVANPVNVFVRSARQLNALGRFHYYWNHRHGYEGQKINYIQETDINFSTYAYDANTEKKIYCGKEFDLQAFDQPHSNRPIGNSELSAVGEVDFAGAFKNNYDGQSHRIIDYCLDVSDVQFVGLFGEIQDATLQNIVMVMSSNPASTNAGRITSDYKTWIDDTRKKYMRASVGALLGMAYDNSYCDAASNTITNCTAAGYKVEYCMSKDINPATPEGLTSIDPLGVVIGGLIGYGESNIKDCSASNEVVLTLDKDYDNSFNKTTGGIVNMGGFVGSYMYNTIENCYSGGFITINDNGKKVPQLRVGGFCAGWLDTRAIGLSYEDYKKKYKYNTRCSVCCQNNQQTAVCIANADGTHTKCKAQGTDFHAFDIKNSYTYTEVSDGIWDVDTDAPVIYAPFASNHVDFYSEGDNVWSFDSIENGYFSYEDSYFVDAVAKLDKIKPGETIHGEAVTVEQLTGNAVASGTNVKVEGTDTHTYIYADYDEDGNIIPYTIAYPYPAVVYDVNGEFIPDDNGEKVYTELVHYGEWFKIFLPDSALAYYEKYADGSYGYHCVTADKDGKNAWVLNTLKDEACVEDGYGLFTKYQLDSLSYKKWDATTASNCTLDRWNTEGFLKFKGYKDYDETLGNGDGDLKESVNASSLYVNMYKLPYELQNRTDIGTFYDQIRFSATAGGKTVINELYCWYNPHFAKAALNLKDNSRYYTLFRPKNVFLRSARHLNALGRYEYYWDLTGGNENSEKVNYIQETDINFSTYVKNDYVGNKDFDLQVFGKTYSNQPIGKSSNAFNNIYDGRGNRIIDYCVDGGTSLGSTGLFGEVNSATLKNIVMVVSSKPKSDNAGLITSSYLIPEGHSLYKAGVGALFGLAIEGEGWNKSNNTITNCAVSGYTVQYLIKPEGRDAAGIAVGGLGGLSMSEITNCTASNDVRLKLERDYTNDALTNHHGLAYLGGFLGSQMYAPVRNSYSGGTIDVIDTKADGDYRAPIIKVGGFCPGWLATNFGYEDTYGTDYANKEATNVKVEYENIYAYTKVSDNVWNESYTTTYVPLVSKMVDWISGGKWNTVPLSENVISFSKNIYIEEVTAAHLAKTSDASKAYYMNGDGNFTATRKSLLGLESYTFENRHNVTVIKDKTNNTYRNPAVDEAGNLIPSEEAYPYPAVINSVDAYGNVQVDGFVHYGDWPEPLENTFVYYEKYADGKYGYYGTISDLESTKTWVLDTLQDKTCTEDGYALLSQFELDTISYDVYAGNKGEAISSELIANTSPIKVQIKDDLLVDALKFKEYEKYDEVLGKPEGEGKESKNDISNLRYMYKLPNDDRQIKDGINGNGFYDRIEIDAVAGGKEVISNYFSLYNPHFAKVAINGIRDRVYKEPTKIFVRSARQLNALGRNPYYWNANGGLAGGAKVTFIQETDINFSTYTKDEFDLQAFGETYSNQPIGSEGGMHFKNIYDGCSHKIIDYCVDGGKNELGVNRQYVGLFGVISDATLKNIVMVVSSEPSGMGGKITSKYETKYSIAGKYPKCESAGVGALVGFVYESPLEEYRDITNRIENCVASGYTVKYELMKGGDLWAPIGTKISIGDPLQPLAIAIGGFAGFSTSDITNCEAVNDVVIELHTDYQYEYDSYYRETTASGGVAYMGGFVGSHTDGKVVNCYSGGTIDVNHNGYSIPELRIGGFCPGWLDAQKDVKGYKLDCDIEYSNIYSYTKVSENVWTTPGRKAWDDKKKTYVEESAKKFTHYVPLVSSMLDYYNIESVESNYWLHDWVIPEANMKSSNNFYLEEVTASHLEETPANVQSFYTTGGANSYATKMNYVGLANYAQSSSLANTVANTYVNGDWDENGNLISSRAAYPYPAVIYDVNGEFKKDKNGEKIYTEYVHYGEWPTIIDTSFVYYEKYANETDGYNYGFYGVMSIPGSDKTWILNTLKDEACVEDGYALLSEFKMNEVNYDLYVGNKETKKSSKLTYSDNNRLEVSQVSEDDLAVAAYDSYNEVMGIAEGEIGSVDVNNLAYMYKLPFDLQFTSRTTGHTFYDRIVFNAKVDGKQVIEGFTGLYNPLFAKTAIASYGESYQNPTNIYIRSARQLNALGRNSYYWSERGGKDSNKEITYIQETDLNFSTYVKNYMGQDFDLQDFDLKVFGESYSNHVIGESYGTPFSNIYDGRSNQIIDYCLDGGEDTHFTGLFGEIKNATLKNIVMTVSSDKKGNAGLITSSYRTHHYSMYNEESTITIRENRAGVGALLGMANTDSGYNTIDNCISSGYTVKYVLKDRSDILQPLQTALRQERGDIIEPLGIAIGGLIGYSPDSISNCAAVNDVVIELHKDYQNTYDNYINRKGNNKSNDGTGGVVYMGGFVGSHYYGKIENCYSGGTIDVIDNGYSIPKLRVGGFCPGWMDTPMKGDYYINCSVEYANIYSYTKVSDNIWNVLGKKEWNSTENVFEDTDDKADTYYVPLVSGMVDYYKYDVRNKEYWLHDQSVLGTNTNFSKDTNYYLLELSATHMKHVLNDSSDVPDKFYLDATGKDITATQMTADVLAGKATIHVDETYLNADTIASTAYPYQAVIKDVKTEKFVHYGDWYDGSIKEGLVERYPTYFEEYEDGYGFWYVKEDGTIVSDITEDPSKVIKRTGYGYLTVHSELATEDKNKVNVDIGDMTYYLQKLPDAELQNLFTGNDADKVCRSFNMIYRKVTTGTELGSGSIIKTLPLYMNPKYGAALSASENLGTAEENPFQIRTKEQFQNVSGANTYYKQTHDVDLAGGHSFVSIGSGSHYDGLSDEGCVIKNASNTLFSTNDGTIEHVSVVSFDTSKVSLDRIVGFVYVNNGMIEHCAIAPRSADDVVIVQGGKAYGFAAENNGTISKAYVVGKIVGTESAAGFVGSNTGDISYCTVGNPNSDVSTIIEADMAFGFAHLNYDATPYENDSSPTIRNCVVTGRVKANTEMGMYYEGNVQKGSAAGFIGENSGTIENSVVYIVNNDAEAVIEGTYASGFAIRGSDGSGFSNIINCRVEGWGSCGKDNASIKATSIAVGFIQKNYGNITGSYVRAMSSYEELVIQGNDAYGFIYMSNGSLGGNWIQKCFVVGTVKAQQYAAGFVGSNNHWHEQFEQQEIISNCYANANVSTSLTNAEAKASGFAHWSGGVKVTDKPDEVTGKLPVYAYWIENCYATGTVSGYTTAGFLYSGFAKNCYTIVEHGDATVKKPWIDVVIDAEVQLNPDNNNSWGYDKESDFNTDIPQDAYAKTLVELDEKADNTEAFPFNEELGTKYPYETYGLTHYGDWYNGGVKAKRASKYPVYYEAYADGSYGFWYVDEYGETGKNLTKDTAKVITDTGYGYLTSSQDEANVDNANIKLGLRTYYLQTVQQPSEMYDPDNADTSNQRYVHFKMDYYSATTGKLISENVSVYMNADYGAGLSGSSDFGTETNPFQVRTKAQFKNVGKDEVAKYIKQTHDVDLAGGHTPVNVNSGVTYYGSSEDGCVIKNAEYMPFNENYGTIKATKVFVTTTNSYEKDVAGFVYRNYGRIEKCAVDANINTVAKGKRAFGFVYANQPNATIKDCSVKGTIKGKAAYGFVYKNNEGAVDNEIAIVENCSVNASIEGYSAYDSTGMEVSGFCDTNNPGGLISNCSVKGSVQATMEGTDSISEAVGFIDVNKGTVSNCIVGDIVSKEPVIVTGDDAAGFVEKNENGATISNCSVVVKVTATGNGVVDEHGDKNGTVSGFMEHNKQATVTNCTAYLKDMDNEPAVKGYREAYGFAEKNEGTIATSKVISTGTATIEGKDMAVGFVKNNTGNISNCEVTNAYNAELILQAHRAFGFMYKNDSGAQVTNCSVVAQILGQMVDEAEAAGFVDLNLGTVTGCAVGTVSYIGESVVKATDAFGFFEKNQDNGIIEDCTVVANVEGNKKAAGFGEENLSTIRNCVVKGTETEKVSIKADDKAGGVAVGFVEKNLGTINDSSVHATDSYEDVVVHGYYSFGFLNANAGTIDSCFVVATIEGELFAMGFFNSNTANVIKNCYTNVHVTGSRSNALINYFDNNAIKDAKIAGFGHESFGGRVENSYACGSISGHMTYGFVANCNNGGSLVNCYTVVEQDADVYRAFVGNGHANCSNCYWGYDEASNYNMTTANESQNKEWGRKTLAELDALAEDTEKADAFSEYLKGQKYPYMTYGLTHYGDWPVPSIP